MQKLPGKLVIIRHGESTWNATGQWTGKSNVHLTDKGFSEAERMGKALEDIHFDVAFTSSLIRTQETLDGFLKSHPQKNLLTHHSSAIDERDYGDYTGKNKWEVKKTIGDDEFQAIRRSWDHALPNGESLKMVYQRVIPFYLNTILPEIEKGKTVLFVGHGNSIRALMKYVESIPDEEIGKKEFVFGTALIYEVDSQGRKVSRNERHIAIELPPA